MSKHNLAHKANLLTNPMEHGGSDNSAVLLREALQRIEGLEAMLQGFIARAEKALGIPPATTPEEQDNRRRYRDMIEGLQRGDRRPMESYFKRDNVPGIKRHA